MGLCVSEVAERLLAGSGSRRYLVLGLLGRTGRSTVVLAVDQLLAREVALKIHHDREQDGRWQALAEARAMARIESPGVVEIFDAGEYDGWAYAAAELCDGDLRWWAQGRAWPEIVERVVEAGRGLAAIHEAGLVHGDVKPENILVKGSRAKLGDLGFAGVPGWSARIVGTPGFVAPEIARGRRGPEGDLFALACSAWVCLSGVMPFGLPADGEVVPDLSRARGGEAIPAELRSALLASLDPDPARRPALEQALARWDACRSSGTVRGWVRRASATLARIGTRVRARYTGATVTDKRAHKLLTHNLRRLTEPSNTPLTVVADRAGIDRAELFAVLAGEREADLEWLFKLADGLGVNASELLREPEGEKR